MPQQAKSLIDEGVGRLKIESAQSGWVGKALQLCSSGQFTAAGPTSIKIRNWEHGVDEPDHIVFDFSDFWLPRSSVYPARRLSDSDCLAIATVLAVDQYLGAVSPSKTRHKTAAVVVQTLAKVWEWGYLHDIHRPEDWTAANFRDLWRELRTGGWPLALQLEDRVKRALLGSPNIDGLLDHAHKKGGHPYVSASKVQNWLQTNMKGRTLTMAHAFVLGRRQVPTSETAYPKYASSVLTLILIDLQRVARLEAPYGFTVDPATVLGASARRAGRAPKRTPNLDISAAVSLLETSMKWVYTYSESILLLARVSHYVTNDCRELSTHRRRARYLNWLADDPWVKALKKEIGAEMEMAPGREISWLPDLIGMLITAAYIVIAMMNARRRDEIRHPKLGLKRDSILELDKDLGLYQAVFYIEKSLKSYAPFYVNKATFDAFQILVSLNQLQVNAERAAGLPPTDLTAAGIFWQRQFRITDGHRTERKWFDFGSGGGHVSRKFIRHVLGEEENIPSLASHMFRRFYALIFFYRFEHGTLQALAHQFGHLDLSATQQYVTDASISSSRERIPIDLLKSSESVREAINDEQMELAKVLDEVGREKMTEMIESLLQGGTYSGGFYRLVQRLHHKLALKVDYSQLDKVVQAKRVATYLIQKGHSVTPFGHGECMAGEVGKRHSARCYSEADSALDRSTASALTCARCPYHVVSIGYLQAQKADLERMRVEIQSCPRETVRASHLLSAFENLSAAIQLHSIRLGAPG